MTKRVLTYGTFDLFHYGHLRLLTRCSVIGDEVHIGLSTDEFNSEKGKTSVWSYEERRANLLDLDFVTSVFPEKSFGQKQSDIRNLLADTVVMGDDRAGKFDGLRALCDVIYLPRTPYISTSLLKQKLYQEEPR